MTLRWRLDGVELHNKSFNRDIAEDWTVYFRVIAEDNAWRVALCRSAYSGKLQLWSRGSPAIDDDGTFEELWEQAVAFYQLTGSGEGFPEQEFNL